MKKTFGVVLTLFLLWGLFAVVLAQDYSPTRKPAATKLEDKFGRMEENLQKQEEKMKRNFDQKEAMFKKRLGEIKMKKQQQEEHLKKFKDEKKKQLLLKIDKNLNTINQNRTRAMLAHLQTLSEIQGRLEERAWRLKAQGVDVVSAQNLIAKAKTDLLDVRTALELQKNKEYVIDPASEINARETAKSVKNELLNDLKKLHDRILVVRDSTIEAHRALNTLLPKVTVTPRVLP